VYNVSGVPLFFIGKCNVCLHVIVRQDDILSFVIRIYNTHTHHFIIDSFS
jgi:hypothetical protein